MEFLSKIHRALLIRNILRPICVFVKSVPFGIHYEILLACNYANVVLLEKKSIEAFERGWTQREKNIIL